MIEKTLKHIFLIFTFLLISYCTNAQQVYLETGFGNAFFEDYVNNLAGNNTLDESYSKPNKPFIEGGFRFNIYKKKAHVIVGTSYNSYKINTAFLGGNVKIPLSYDLTYVALKVGVNLDIIRHKRFIIQLNAHFSHDWLTAGTSSYNDVVFDLYKENTLDSTLIRFHRGIALQYRISRKISTYINYNVAHSFQDKYTDSQADLEYKESYSFKTKSVSFGLIFEIRSRKYRR
jgi:hypothetical protein